jgi:inhibitor of KinA
LNSSALEHDHAIPAYPRIRPVGETAFTIEFGDRVDENLNRRVHALDALLEAASLAGIVERIPTYRSLLIVFDPLTTDTTELQTELLQLATGDLAQNPVAPGRLIEIPVHYGGNDGPDLGDVATHCGLTAQEVIAQHAAATYQVAMLGFAPGFTYLLGLPSALSTPRLATPRLQVPPGSVGIAGSQTGIYALSTPGGWRIIGRTPLRLFDSHRNNPFVIEAGDRVRFVVD